MRKEQLCLAELLPQWGGWCLWRPGLNMCLLGASLWASGLVVLARMVPLLTELCFHARE